MSAVSRQSKRRGGDLHLTCDIGLKRVADQAMGEEDGTVVAIDPDNGEILALVSKPTFEPTQFVNGISQTAYDALRAAPYKPLFNRVLRGQYPPGSTIKPFMALAALNTDTITPEKSIFCPGYWRLPNDNHRYRCWRRTGHGPLDIKQAIAQSCDVYFYELGYNTGIKAINETLAPFGFGSATGIDMPGELSGVLPSKEWKRRARGESWYHGETVITSIGQGFFLTTPLQLAQATASLARKGHRVRPHLLDHRGSEGPADERSDTGTSPERIHIKRETDWELITDAMVEVVHGKRGTARAIAPEEYRMAGKTGTSQVYGLPPDEEEVLDEEEIERKLRDHALFIAFAPAEDPRIAVAVVVEHGGSGSAAAAPVARAVVDAYLEDGSQDDT
jgi:penicillin-binding protein 2